MNQKWVSLFQAAAIVLAIQLIWFVFQISNTFSDGAAYIGLPFPFIVIGGEFFIGPLPDTPISLPLLVTDILFTILIALAIWKVLYARSKK